MLPTSNDRPAAARHTPVGRQVCLLLSRARGARDCDDAFAPEKRKNSKHRINWLPINSLSIFCRVVTVWHPREVSAPHEDMFASPVLNSSGRGSIPPRFFYMHSGIAVRPHDNTRGPLKLSVCFAPHLNLKLARWIEPSFNSTTNCRQVPAQD
jgi:hypothetical protein